MRIVEISVNDFENFAANHPLRNYCQTPKYAMLMNEKGYSSEYIGYQDDSNNLVAASLILTKKADTFNKFAYAPKGFLIDYYSAELVKRFVKDAFHYYRKRGFCFLKINPEIVIAEYDPYRNYAANYNQNVSIIDTLKDAGFKRRRELVPLDFIYPRVTAYLNLKAVNFDNFSEDVKEKFKAAEKNGLRIEEVTSKEVNILYDCIKTNTKESLSFMRSIANIYTNGEVDVLLVKADYEECLINARKRYEREMELNDYWNNLIQSDNSETNLTNKMLSDKNLIMFKNELVNATEKLKLGREKYVGGAIVIKFENRVSILYSGCAPQEDLLFVNHFLFKTLVERYRDSYDLLDLNGLASNFSENSKYFTFNKEKLDFSPNVYEFIGEFDLIINEGSFKKIQSKGILSKEFLPSTFID